jgi:hypothetical protein
MNLFLDRKKIFGGESCLSSCRNRESPPPLLRLCFVAYAVYHYNIVLYSGRCMLSVSEVNTLCLLGAERAKSPHNLHAELVSGSIRSCGSWSKSFVSMEDDILGEVGVE